MESSITKAWELYEQGRTYNSSLIPNQYDLVEANTEFFIGNQWPHLRESPEMRNIYKPTFNIISRIASLFIASITSSGVAVHIEPLSYYDGSGTADPNRDTAGFANAEIDNLLEKFKFDYRVRDALFDGAQTGDYCAHFWFDPDAAPYGSAFSNGAQGEIRMELVDGINVMFGNPNDRSTENQPYILLIGRDTVEHLRQEAQSFRRNRQIYQSGKAADSSDVDDIQPDSEYQDFTGVGGKTELSGEDNAKALYVLMYSKVTELVPAEDADGNPVFEPVTDNDGFPVYEYSGSGKERQILTDADGQPVPKRRQVKTLKTSIHVTKATRSSIIYEDVDTGLSVYPIAWGNWEHQKNQYHGRALVTGLIPNQLFLNKMFALAMTHMQTMAIPKIIYNADMIPTWDNAVGSAIGIHGGINGDMPQVAYPVPTAEMSRQIFDVIDKVMQYTKECLGATDAQMGNVKPDNTSALMVLQTNAEVPLENIRAGINEWVEDAVKILLDMMGTYYGLRPIRVRKDFTDIVTDAAGQPQIDPQTGQIATKTVQRYVMEPFDFSLCKGLWLNVGVDVGAAPYYSKIAMVQTLDGLLRNNVISALQYLERMPDDMIPKRQDLIDDLQSQPAGDAANPSGGMFSPAPAGKNSPIVGADLDAEKMDYGLPQSTLSMISRGGYPSIAKRAARRVGNIRASR